MKVIFDNADSFLPELGGARGMTGITKMTTVPWVVFFLLVSVLIVRNTVHSSYGRAIISIREDEIAAETMGIDTFRHTMIGFLRGGRLLILPPGYVELRWVLIPVLLIETMLLRPQGLFDFPEFPFPRGR